MGPLYRGYKDPRKALRTRIREIAQTRLRYGYRKIRVLLNREGWYAGKYLVERIYREEGLTLLQRRKRRHRVAEHRRERFHPTGQSGVVDGICGASTCGRKKVPIADGRGYPYSGMLGNAWQSNRSRRLKGEDVVMALNRIKIQRGVPKFLCCDKGSEFSSQALDLWAYQNRSAHCLFAPREPTDNAFVESFSGTFRAECLECCIGSRR